MSAKLIHRDVSWVSFNERVLQEAEDQKNPLYERLKFLAIFSSNLDEFYRVRISELRQFKMLKKDVRKKLNEQPKKVIKDIQEKVFQLQERFGTTYRQTILPALQEEQIFLVEKKAFTEDQVKYLKHYFKTQVAAHIKVVELATMTSLDFLHDKELFLYLESDVLINIPTEHCPRFVEIPTENAAFHVTYLDEVVRLNLDSICPSAKNSEAYSVKITRDGEMYFDEYDGEVVELIKANLIQRETGIPTRMLYDYTMPKPALKRLRKYLHLNKTDLMPGGRYHNFSDFFGFPQPPQKAHLNYPDLTPLPHAALEDKTQLIEYIRTQDVLLNFPYQKYDYIPRMIEEAANRADILAVNITLYRVSKQSKIAEALLTCIEKGKQVTVFIEAKARFDEANNIYWGDKLSAKGAHVLYSMPKIKVHSKIFLLEGTNFSIGHIGTGNFNENSAKLYTDFALLTADAKITGDLKEVFNYLKTPEGRPHIQKLWVSPFNTRSAIYEKIDREIQHVQAGKLGYVRFKMNSLEDEAVINKLYEASQAGVKIELIVRGICRLTPQVEGLSENIKILSIVGRFLEHGRIYYFRNDGNEEFYIASADCMTRNLDKRIEVAAPIEDPMLKTILKHNLHLQWHDNMKARILEATLSNKYQDNDLNAIDSQLEYYHYLQVMNSSTTLQ